MLRDKIQLNYEWIYWKNIVSKVRYAERQICNEYSGFLELNFQHRSAYGADNLGVMRRDVICIWWFKYHEREPEIRKAQKAASVIRPYATSQIMRHSGELGSDLNVAEMKASARLSSASTYGTKNQEFKEIMLVGRISNC